MTLTPDELNSIRQAAYDGAYAGAMSLERGEKVDATTVVGPLNEYGAHQLFGFGIPGMWYFTELGWDNAETDMQRANIATQVGIDLETGELTSTGPDKGFAEGRISNPFIIDLFKRGKPNAAGDTPWVPVDESAGRKFDRLRVRSRDISVIINAAIALQNAKPSASHP